MNVSLKGIQARVLDTFPELRVPQVSILRHGNAPMCLDSKFYVEYTVGWSPHMETVQIVLDKNLLQAADQAARRTKQNRSALVREALREHLRRLDVLACEARDREGYARKPQDESPSWEAEAVWPAE
jgi:predicted transcriptional regulator